MSSCSTRRRVFLFYKKTCPLVEQEDMSSCSTRRHILLFYKKTCLLVEQENMSSCSPRRHVFLFNKNICLLVEQEDTSACSTRRYVFLFNTKTYLLVEQEDMFSCSTRRYVFFFNKKTCLWPSTCLRSPPRVNVPCCPKLAPPRAGRLTKQIHPPRQSTWGGGYFYEMRSTLEDPGCNYDDAHVEPYPVCVVDLQAKACRHFIVCRSLLWILGIPRYP